MRKIPIAKPMIGEDEIENVKKVLISGTLAQGPKVKKFEKEFASAVGSKYCVSACNGTAAIYIALSASGVSNGDEVITTPFTFISTANSILFCNAKPIFVDIDEKTFNINPDLINEKITPKTKVILPVHLYGQPCDMMPIIDICEDYELVLIEDACQAHNAEYNGKKVGDFGTGCFSFYATKNMTTGEGGMITTDDKKIAERARMLRDHGRRAGYFHETLGFNNRMTDIAAAIGICQLRKLDQMNSRRIENAEFLTKGIKQVKGLIPPYVAPYAKHVFHQYTIRVTDDFCMSRDELRRNLNERGIETGVYYPIPIHKQPLYKKIGYNDYLPISEKVAEEVISLPVHPSLLKEDLKRIIEVINI